MPFPDRVTEARPPMKMRPSKTEAIAATSTTLYNVFLCDSLSEVIAWVLVIIMTVLFTGLLSAVLLWILKQRQPRDTHSDNSSPKYEMDGNPCYEAGVERTTNTTFYEEGRAK